MEQGRIARLRRRVEEGAEWAASTAWRPVVIARKVYVRDRDIGGGLLAGAIAFRLFVWLASFVVVLIAILGFIDAGGGDPAADLSDGAGITAIAAQQVAQTAHDANQARWVLLAIGLYTLFSTSRTMVRALWASTAIAWRVPVSRPPIVKGVLVYNAMILALLASVRGAAWLRDATPGPGIAITLSLIVLFLGLTWLALQWLPGPGVEPRELLPGAVLLAVGLHLMQLVSTLYLPHRLERASDTYGTLGTAVVLLLWLYLFGRLIVAGGVLNATLKELRDEAEAAS